MSCCGMLVLKHLFDCSGLLATMLEVGGISTTDRLGNEAQVKWSRRAKDEALGGADEEEFGGAIGCHELPSL